MINLKNIKQVYLLGIGGIGMSALARYFNHNHYEVSGYDRTCSALTDELEKEGIAVHFDDRSSALSSLLAKDETLVIYTPAVPADWGERAFLTGENYHLLKRSEVLGILCDRARCGAVAGTHGKTSVSTMLAHLMKGSGTGCNAFLGGISKNYETNLLLSSASEWIVAEADEFDRSFLSLHPDMAVITSMDADHLDIYGTHENLIRSFLQFAGQIRQGGVLFLKQGLRLPTVLNSDVKIYTYALEEMADYRAENIHQNDGYYSFDLIHPQGKMSFLKLACPGLMNVENAVAALAMALYAGVDEDSLRKGLESYLGVHRRFDIRLQTSRFLVIDEYAHHPRELEATISYVRHLYPGKHLTGIFQPHLYSRTADLAAGFAKALSQVDELLLLDIYPARELPIEGVSSTLILDQTELKKKKICSKAELVKGAACFEPGIIVFMGAGDIGQLVGPVCQILKELSE